MFFKIVNIVVAMFKQTVTLNFFTGNIFLPLND